MNTPDSRATVVVLFGGQSAEHDVSCVTAAHVIKAADPTKYRLVPVGITRQGQWVLATPDVSAQRLEATGTATTASVIPTLGNDIVVMPLLHGPLGEDGTVQGLLEVLDMPYVGSGVLSSAIAMDKTIAKDICASHGIAQPRYTAIRQTDVTPTRLQEISSTLGLPLFVKPANMGSSVGVSKATNLLELITAANTALAYDEWILIEEAIVGREIEVSVLGNQSARASVPGEIIPGNDFYDYNDKYIDDGAQLLVPAPLTTQQTTEVQQLALEIFSALRCDGMARVDFFFEENGRGFLCNEVNTIPGFTPISMYPKLWQASGLEYTALIDELILLAHQRHSRRKRNTQR
ncbi:MAG: D-alanine--D-alanine ligase [Ilumatobacteraceae bacterium]|nr:D-alanine--D-alanine ligase [Ilumatobacteraceae bacterium]